MADYVTKAIAKITRYLTKSRTEPKIEYKCSQKCDRHNCYWQVYDPVSSFHGCFSSELEVKAWLDSRYYYD